MYCMIISRLIIINYLSNVLYPSSSSAVNPKSRDIIHVAYSIAIFNNRTLK